MNESITPVIGQGEDTVLLIKQNEHLARLVEQNMVIIDLLEKGSTSQPEVTIANFNMPFWALVGFLIKVALASIPALVVLAIVGFILSFILAVFGIAIF